MIDISLMAYFACGLNPPFHPVSVDFAGNYFL